MKFLRLLWKILAAAGALLAVAVQVAPDDAISKLSDWGRVSGVAGALIWLASPTVLTRVGVLLFVVASGLGLLLRSRRQNELVPIKEAVKALYDHAQNNAVISFASVQDTEDERLAWLANEIWRRAPLRVRLSISNAYNPVATHQREERFLDFQDGQPRLVDLQGIDEQVVSTDICILRGDLEKAIAQLRKSGRKLSAKSSN